MDGGGYQKNTKERCKKSKTCPNTDRFIKVKSAKLVQIPDGISTNISQKNQFYGGGLLSSQPFCNLYQTNINNFYTVQCQCILNPRIRAYIRLHMPENKEFYLNHVLFDQVSFHLQTIFRQLLYLQVKFDRFQTSMLTTYFHRIYVVLPIFNIFLNFNHFLQLLVKFTHF